MNGQIYEQQKLEGALRVLLNLLALVCLVGCPDQGEHFVQKKSYSYENKFYGIQIQKGFYRKFWMDTAFRIVVVKDKKHKVVVDEYSDGPSAFSLDFSLFSYRDRQIIFTDKWLFYFYVLDAEGNLISTFPVKYARVQSLKINKSTGAVKLRGTSGRRKVFDAYSNDGGLSWKVNWLK